MESSSASPHSAGEPEKQNNFVVTSPTLEPGMEISMPRTQPNFALFPQFPFEIREKIWSAAIEPRSFKITIPEVKEYSNSELEYHYNRSPEHYLKPKASPREVPALLHTSHEAREIGLKSYNLNFSDRLDNRPIHFNFELDTLLFKDSYIFLDFCSTPNPLRLMRIGTEPGLIISLASQQYRLCELQKQLRHLAFEIVLNRKLYKVLLDFEQLETAYFLKQLGWESLDSLPIEVEERNFVNHWEKAAIRRGQAFEKLPSVEHLDKIEFYAKFQKF
jgi:hypothetical protein